MKISHLTCISKPNRQLILLLAIVHLLWSLTAYLLWQSGQFFDTKQPLWSSVFIALQLFIAAQLLLPMMRFQPEHRSRSFYLFWGLFLLALIWGSNQIPVASGWESLASAVKSGLLLFVATLIGAGLASHVHRLWQLLPICIAMTIADFASWAHGPTATFSRQIEEYYLAPEGAPPLIDMLLVKLAYPGSAIMAPSFGFSDWIMVVFFAVVAQRHAINDNLFGPKSPQARHFGRYLPISVTALFIAISTAQVSGLFIPALPVIALIVLFWFGLVKLVHDRNG